jgi:hypothetical protein
MTGPRLLSDELGEVYGLSQSAALCYAIIEDAEVARQFELEPRSAVELLCVAMLGPTRVPCLSPPLPGELSRLMA